VYHRVHSNLGAGYNIDTHLTKPCSISVHDYGSLPDGTVVYYINGVQQEVHTQGHEPGHVGGGLSSEVWGKYYHSVAELLQGYPPNFFERRPPHCHVRWVDVGGMNGQILQYLLHVVGCEHRNTFNHIVDLRQRAMALTLETDIDTEVAYLIVTKVPHLRGEELPCPDPRQGLEQLYSHRKTLGRQVDDSDEDLISYEQIAYLLKRDEQHTDGSKPGGTLISFQEGIEGDPFDEVRYRLRTADDVMHRNRRGVSYLLIQLIDLSAESAGSVDNYMESVVSRLKAALETSWDSDNLQLITVVRLCALVLPALGVLF